MANDYLAERLKGIQAALVAHHAGGSAMPASSSGREREAFLLEFLGRVFPTGLRFGTGAVTDSAGNRSGQLDVIVEYPILPSFPMPTTEERLYLAESVGAVISVKSDLSKQWSEVEAEGEKLGPLRRKWLAAQLRRNGTVTFDGPEMETAIPFFAVGYTGYKTIDGLRERLNSTAHTVRPLAAMSIDSGVFVATTGREASGVWGLYALAVTVATELKELFGVGADPWSYL